MKITFYILFFFVSLPAFSDNLRIQQPGTDKVSCVQALVKATIESHNLPGPTGEMSMIRKKSRWPFWGVSYVFSYALNDTRIQGTAHPIVLINRQQGFTTCYFSERNCTGTIVMKLWNQHSGNVIYQLNAIEDDMMCAGDAGTD